MLYEVDDTTLYHSLSKPNCVLTNSTAHRASMTTAFKERWITPLNTALITVWLTLITSITLKYSTPQTWGSLVWYLMRTQFESSNSHVRGHLLPAHDCWSPQTNEHLKFHSHADHIIDKTKHALHGLIKLGKAGVRSHSLDLFYKARILSVLSYAAPCWFPHTSQNDKVQLERF